MNNEIVAIYLKFSNKKIESFFYQNGQDISENMKANNYPYFLFLSNKIIVLFGFSYRF